jgi:hypothetical protein
MKQFGSGAIDRSMRLERFLVASSFKMGKRISGVWFSNVSPSARKSLGGFNPKTDFWTG